MKALFSGADFKKLISAVTKLPSLGAFGGSEMINLEISNGQCLASSFGVVLSTAQAPAKGKFQLCSVDERLLIPFSSLCADTAKIMMELSGQEVKFRASNHREITAPFMPGKKHYIQTEGQMFNVTPEAAQKITYLADIAFSDSSRPELNAVYLPGDQRAIAVNQKAIAVLKCFDSNIQKAALPIPLARIIGENYSVYVSKETVIKNGLASYAMPSPVKAFTSFPISVVDQFEKAEKKKLGVASGEKLIQMISECDNCLSGISRLEVVLQLNLSPNQIELTSQNGGAKFRGTIPAQGFHEEMQLQIPLEEVSRAGAFLAQEQQIKIAQGVGGETFFDIPDGWVVFPSSQTKGKKKKKNGS